MTERHFLFWLKSLDSQELHQPVVRTGWWPNSFLMSYLHLRWQIKHRHYLPWVQKLSLDLA